MERKPSKQPLVGCTPELITHSFDLADIKSINIEAHAPGGRGPKPPQQFRVQIVVVKPPPA
ncbi:MAG TPA: hypothetical protein VFE77_02385 [Rhodanobacter sp.]|nr:hypothetical protein [Rhodanobacter sp.]